MARSITTTDHDTIRRWAEERGGKPSEVASTAQGDDVGIIRIDFPGYSGEGKLQEISWDDWFGKFDASNLALVYEEETADGQRSNFNKLIGRETAEARAKGEKTNRRSVRSGARRSSASRQAARPEAARTARSKRSTRGGSTASRGSAQGKKRTSARKRTTASTTARSTGAASSRKGGRARGARKSR